MTGYADANHRLATWLCATAGASVGLVAVGTWAFAEATFWFIAPDFLIIILCVFAPESWKRIAFFALLGSLAGGILSFMLNGLFFDRMGEILRATPFVEERMLTEIDDLYRSRGLQGVLFQSFSFMQFKIWTHLAVAHGFQPIVYFGLVGISRGIRFLIVAFAAQLAGRLAPRFFARHAALFLVLYTTAFLAMLLAVET